MKTLSIEIPDELLAELQARASAAGGCMSVEALASVLIRIGVISCKSIQVLNDNQTIDQAHQTRIETVAMHLSDFMRMYFDKLQLLKYATDMQVLAGMQETIGSALVSGWVSAATLILQGHLASDVHHAAQQIGNECEYDNLSVDS